MKFGYFLASLLAMSISAYADESLDDYAIIPYRPSVSSPAQLPSAGHLELELGGLSSKTNDEHRNSVPYGLKLAFNQEWGILVGGEAYVSTNDGQGNRDYGFGDTTLVLKHAFLMSDTTAMGLEFGVKLPTAKDSVGSGKTDYSVNGILSHDFGDVHLDANLNFTHVGLVNAGEASIQTGEAASFSYPLNEKLAVIAELSGVQRSGTASTAQLLTAITYSPSKVLTFDVGAAKGLNQASQDYSLFFGMVLPIAKLW